MVRLATTVLLCCLAMMAAGLAGPVPDRKQCTGKEKEICNVCHGFPRDVSLRVRNNLKAPFFEGFVTIRCTRYATLFYIMQQAAEVDPMFKFQATYFKGLGFSINAINNVAGTYNEDRSYWEILDGNLYQTPVGASTYIPSRGETVTFNLTVAGPY